MKRFLCTALSLTLGLTLLAGCGGSDQKQTISSGNVNANGYLVVANSPDEVKQNASKGALAAATGFTFDFETLNYSFNAVDNAAFYYIRVFEVVDGKESNSASFQSDKIDANGAGSYSGAIQGETLLAGSYVAHVVASASGYTSSDATVSGSSTRMVSPKVTATWEKDGDSINGAKISITPGDNVGGSFTVVIVNGEGQEVYKNDNAGAGDIKLSPADLKAPALSKDDKYTVTVTVKAPSGYSAPAPVEAKISEQQMGGPGGGPGGGGGMAGWDVEPTNVSFPEGAESFAFQIGEHDYLHTTANLQAAPTAGSTYTYVLAKGDAGAPFDAEMVLELKADGTAHLSVGQAGPMSGGEADGTWTAAGGTINVNW